MPRLLLMTAALALSGCAHMPRDPVAAPVAEAPKGWRGVATAEDQARIDHMPAIWTSALSGVPVRARQTLSREGELLKPEAGRDHALPTPGSYRCRLVRLGPGGKRAPAVRSFPDNFCYVRGEEDGRLSFAKQTGTELPGGWLMPDGASRLVLVGARQHTPGDVSLTYGQEPDRDIVGLLERIGPFRWRLALPWRDADAGLDIYELTPVPSDQQADEPRVTQVAREKSLRTP